MLLALVVLICWPVVEVWIAIQLSDAIGVIPMVLLLFAGWPLGRWALRSRGRAAWRRFALAVAEGRTPGREVVDGALVLLGGLLLMLPGFLSDALGILLLAPTRAPLRGLLMRNFDSPLIARTVRMSRTARAYDVDSTARDIDHSQLPR